VNEPAEREPEPEPERAVETAQPRRRLRLRIALGAAALLVGAGSYAFGWLLLRYPDTRGPGRGRVVEIEIARGDGVKVVAERLAEAGALRDARLFAAYATVRGAEDRLRAGTVLLYDNMRPRELLQRVATGFGSAVLRVVIPEGFSRFDIASRLERWGVCGREDFLRATLDPRLLSELAIEGPSAEGLLFPDTYLLREGMNPAALVQRFVRNARRRLAPLLAEHAATVARLREEFGWGTHELLTLASIVEKEARLASERPVIAGVFLNRLRNPEFKPKRLQADPTVSYGCLIAPALASCAAAPGKTITRAMLADSDNPYNTYKREGLPPGPIANPGLPSVRAVLVPAAHGYLYFVAQRGGAHAFSATLADHLAAVERLRAPSP
jgi:UPF0755 protein